MYILLAVLIIGYGSLNKAFSDENDTRVYGDDWREVLQEENDSLLEEQANVEQRLADYDQEFGTSNQDEYGFDDKRYDIEMDEPNLSLIDSNQYYLDEDIQPAGYGVWQFVAESSLFLSVVSLLTIIIAAGIIAHEFRWGTIKLLLIRPISRTKILFSKYAAVLLFALLTLLFVLSVAWISGALLFGIESIHAQMPLLGLTEDGGFEERFVPVMEQVINGYSYGLVNLVMMSTFAFMISAIFRNSSLAIGTAIFLMLTGTSISQMFLAFELDFAKYLLFSNTNLKMYADGNVFVDGMTMGFSITVLIVYYVVFLALAWIVFEKRDVT